MASEIGTTLAYAVAMGGALAFIGKELVKSTSKTLDSQQQNIANFIKLTTETAVNQYDALQAVLREQKAERVQYAIERAGIDSKLTDVFNAMSLHASACAADQIVLVKAIHEQDQHEAAARKETSRKLEDQDKIRADIAKVVKEELAKPKQ